MRCNLARIFRRNDTDTKMTDSLFPFVEDRELGASHRHGLRPHVCLADPFDVIVIGSGAGGAVAAETFVRAGLRTLLMEEGGRLRHDATNAAVDAAAPKALAGSDKRG